MTAKCRPVEPFCGGTAGPTFYLHLLKITRLNFWKGGSALAITVSCFIFTSSSSILVYERTVPLNHIPLFPQRYTTSVHLLPLLEDLSEMFCCRTPPTLSAYVGPVLFPFFRASCVSFFCFHQTSRCLPLFLSLSFHPHHHVIYPSSLSSPPSII